MTILRMTCYSCETARQHIEVQLSGRSWAWLCTNCGSIHSGHLK